MTVIWKTPLGRLPLGEEGEGGIGGGIYLYNEP